MFAISPSFKIDELMDALDLLSFITLETLEFKSHSKQKHNSTPSPRRASFCVFLTVCLNPAFFLLFYVLKTPCPRDVCVPAASAAEFFVVIVKGK